MKRSSLEGRKAKKLH